MNSPTLSFRQLFLSLFILFAGLLAASALSAWTGPTATAPAGNVAAPINVGTIDQVKNAGISMNSLAVFGSSYIQNKLGIGQVNPVVALDVNGSIKLGNGGELCQAISAGAQRYNSTTNVMEYCNGTAWTAFGSSGSSAGSQNFTEPGTYPFMVPTYTTLTVVAWGGGGGGGSLDGSSGGAGGNTTFDVISAGGGNGGGRGLSGSLNGAGGAGGTASGGTTNTNGNHGGNANADSTTSGGSAPNGGVGGDGDNSSTFPAGVWQSGFNALGGSAPGGGGGGSGQALGGGGSGSYSTKTYAADELSGTINVTVGAGGTAGAGTYNGGAGGRGAVYITWQGGSGGGASSPIKGAYSTYYDNDTGPAAPGACFRTDKYTAGCTCPAGSTPYQAYLANHDCGTRCYTVLWLCE